MSADEAKRPEPRCSTSIRGKGCFFLIQLASLCALPSSTRCRGGAGNVLTGIVGDHAVHDSLDQVALDHIVARTLLVGCQRVFTVEVERVGIESGQPVQAG